MIIDRLEDRRLLAGVTLLAHGINGNINGWVAAASQAIVERAEPTCFRVLNVQAAFPRTSGWTPLDWRNQGALVNQWIMNDAGRTHRFVFVFPSAGLIPPGFLHRVPGVVRVEVTPPEFTERRQYIASRSASNSDQHAHRMAGLTEGMNWLDLRRLMEVYDRAHPRA